MDLLSDVLRHLRLDSAVLSLAELRAPRGLDKSRIEGAPFHAVLEGLCLLELAQGPLFRFSVSAWKSADRVALQSSTPRGRWARTDVARILAAMLLDEAATGRAGFQAVTEGCRRHLRRSGA